jgi:hypothetical protein
MHDGEQNKVAEFFPQVRIVSCPDRARDFVSFFD